MIVLLIIVLIVGIIIFKTLDIRVHCDKETKDKDGKIIKESHFEFKL